MIQTIQDFFHRIFTFFIGSAKSSKDSQTAESLPTESDISPPLKKRAKRDLFSGKRGAQPDDVQGDEKQIAQAETWDLSEFSVVPKEGSVRFHDLDLPVQIMHAIHDLGFTYCTPIQAEILPSTLKGQDAYGRAQTGTGKTAAFLIAALNRLFKSNTGGKRPSGNRAKGTPRVLVLAPTRELVLQIAEEAEALAKYLPVSIVKIFGGMDYEKQRRQLVDKKVDIVVATPGRLLDFKRHKDVYLGKVEILVIDEADRMLDMGFIPDVRKIVYSTPNKSHRQTMLFSATLTDAVTQLSGQWTRDPVSVEIEPEHVTVDTVDQKVYVVTSDEKFALLYNIITRQELDRIIVFCNRRDETRRLGKLFEDYKINCALLSGEIPQKKRIRTLESFKSGKIRVLVATDVAGRGIHIENMSHVINFALPQDPEDYVHRIGRTGRAGATGTSVSFACEDDGFYIPAIEEFIGRKLSCAQPPEEWLQLPPKPARRRRRPRKRQPAEGRSSHQGENRSRDNRNSNNRSRYNSSGNSRRDTRRRKRRRSSSAAS